MANLEYLDEYMDEEILVDDQPTSYNIQESQNNEKTALDDEYAKFLQAGCSKTLAVMPVKKTSKRKLQNEPTIKKSKSRSETSKPKKDAAGVGQIIKLYAYKHCLGKYDSLIRNADMPLWFRDGTFLFQKYLRQRCNDDGLFYYSTQIYSCWEEQRVDEYLELEAEIIMKNSINLVVKIRMIDFVEDICLNGNYKELGLMPYSSYQYRTSDPKIDDSKIYTIKLSTSDETSDIDYDEQLDENTSNDVIEQHIEDLEP